MFDREISHDPHEAETPKDYAERYRDYLRQRIERIKKDKQGVFSPEEIEEMQKQAVIEDLIGDSLVPLDAVRMHCNLGNLTPERMGDIKYALEQYWERVTTTVEEFGWLLGPEATSELKKFFRKEEGFVDKVITGRCTDVGVIKSKTVELSDKFRREFRKKFGGES